MVQYNTGELADLGLKPQSSDSRTPLYNDTQMLSDPTKHSFKRCTPVGKKFYLSLNIYK